MIFPIQDIAAISSQIFGVSFDRNHMESSRMYRNTLHIPGAEGELGKSFFALINKSNGSVRNTKSQTLDVSRTKLVSVNSCNPAVPIFFGIRVNQNFLLSASNANWHWYVVYDMAVLPNLL